MKQVNQLSIRRWKNETADVRVQLYQCELQTAYTADLLHNAMNQTRGIFFNMKNKLISLFHP